MRCECTQLQGNNIFLPAVNTAAAKGFGSKHPDFLKCVPAATVAACAWEECEKQEYNSPSNLISSIEI